MCVVLVLQSPIKDTYRVELSPDYLERLKQWMLANNVEDEKKVCVFLSVIGADTKESSVSSSTTQYDDLTRAQSTHYKPAPVEIA